MPQQAQFVIPPPLCVVTARLNVIFAKLHNAFFFLTWETALLFLMCFIFVVCKCFLDFHYR